MTATPNMWNNAKQASQEALGGGTQGNMMQGDMQTMMSQMMAKMDEMMLMMKSMTGK